MTQILSYYQKRHAALIYHFMSLDYLQQLKRLVDDAVGEPDAALERAERLGVDSIIANDRWGVRDTAANWGTGAWPFLKSMQQNVAEDIAKRALAIYEPTGVAGSIRGINEFSMLWASEEQEKAFKAKLDAVYDHAQGIDGAMRRPADRTDATWESAWSSLAKRAAIPRIPRFVVRTDIVGKSGSRPPLSGVYIPQSDSFGTCQFAWTSDSDGALGDALSLNALGRELVSKTGHKALFNQDGTLLALLKGPDYWKRYKLEMMKEDWIQRDPSELDIPVIASIFVSSTCFTRAPADWYYLEPIECEYDPDPEFDPFGVTGSAHRQLIEGGKPCSREGFWMTPARAGSRRYFKSGEVLPDFGASSSYGLTLWQWDADQSAPKL